MRRRYTGVGSRDLPDNIRDYIYTVAKRLESLGYTVSSGNSWGCDKAFTSMVKAKETYQPQPADGYYLDDGRPITKEAIAEVRSVLDTSHWNNMNDYAKKLHSRNVYQVLGYDLKFPTEFMICYTKDGKDVGGTRTAILIARKHNIPIYNIGTQDDIKRLEAFLDTIKPPVYKGVEINSKQFGLAFALTNPTHSYAGKKWFGKGFRKPHERNIPVHKYLSSKKIKYKGKDYIDVEEAYQLNKSTDTGIYKDIADYALMVELMEIKLRTFPRLIKSIRTQGGSEWLKACTHQPYGAKTRWHTNGDNMFIVCLVTAYNRVN